MSECSTISAGISVSVGEVSPVYFSLNLRPPREFSLGFGTISACFWRCTKLLLEVSPVCARTATILGEIVSTSASLPELSLEALPPVSFLSGSVPLRHLLGAVAVYYRGSLSIRSYKNYSWGNLFHIRQPSRAVSGSASPPCFLSGSVPSRHLLGAVPSYYRGSLQYSIVQKPFLGKSFPHSLAFQSCLWKRVPPVSSLSGLVPPRHLLGAVAVYYRGSLQYSIVQKLFLGKYFPPSPAFQSCLWKRVPPVSSLSGSVLSMHLLGAVPSYYRRSLQYSIVQKLFLGKSFPHSPAFQSCLWKRFPPVSFLSGSVPSRHLLGAVAVYYRGSLSIRSYRNYSWGNLFHIRQPSRAVSGSTSPP